MGYNLFDCRPAAMVNPIARPSKDPGHAPHAGLSTEQTDSPNKASASETKYEQMVRAAEKSLEMMNTLGQIEGEHASILKAGLQHMLSATVDLEVRISVMSEQCDLLKINHEVLEKKYSLLREEMKEPQNGSVDRLPSKLQEKQVSQ
jgi:hypothetical protein